MGGTWGTAQPGAHSLRAPLGVGAPPGGVGARCPRGAPEPRCAPTHAVRPARAAAQWPPLRAPRPSAVPRMPGPQWGDPARPDPTAATPARWGPGGGTARTACGAGAELPGGGRSAAAGAASHPPQRARSLARSPRRARATAARSLARSPPPLAPRAHNEAAGREVVPAAASAPLPQSMPPPAEHLALGWEGGPWGRGLGPGLDLQGVGSGPGWGMRTPPQGAPLVSLGSQTWPLWVDLSTPPPGEAPGSAPPTSTPAHSLVGSDYCGLPRGPRGRLTARPGGAQLFLPFLFLPRNSLPPLPQGYPPFHAPLGAKTDGRPDRHEMNFSPRATGPGPDFCWICGSPEVTPVSLNCCSLRPKTVVPKRNGYGSYRARSGLKGASSPLDSLSPQLEAASPSPRTGTGRVTDREAGWEAQTELGEGVGRDFQSQTQPPCQAHKEPAHSPAAARSLRAAPVPVPAAWGTCCSAHRPKPPPAAPPTGSPGLLDTPLPRHTMPRSSLACTRTLLSFPSLATL